MLSTKANRAESHFGSRILSRFSRFTGANTLGVLVTVFAAVSLADVPRESGWTAGGTISLVTLLSMVTGYTAIGLSPWLPRVAVALGLVPLSIALSTEHVIGVEIFVIVFCLVAVAIRSRVWHQWVVAGVYTAWSTAVAVKAHNPTFGWVYIVIVFIATGVGLGVRHFVVDRVKDRQRIAQLEAENKSIRTQERDSLAAELHDIVAHQLSIIDTQVLLSGGSKDPVRLQTALARIDQASRAALIELRTLLGVLRDVPTPNAAHPHDISSQDDIEGAVQGLKATLQDAGFRPRIEVNLGAGSMDALTHNTVRRVLKEASTNIMRYAAMGSECTLAVFVGPDDVHVQVISRLSDVPRPSALSNGLGLRGLGERIKLTAGTFQAGPVDENWVVTAVLPIDRFHTEPLETTYHSDGASAVRPITIALADDKPEIREAYRMILSRYPEFELVGEAADGLGAVELYRDKRPDIMLMDLQMPDISGTDAIAAIRRTDPDACLVVMTVFSTWDAIAAALRAGARGYLMKGDGEDVLIRTIHEAMADEMPLSAEVRRALSHGIRDGGNNSMASDVVVTPREAEVAHWLSRGLTNRQIGRQMYLSEGAVKQHLWRLGEKLHVHGRAAILARSMQLGIVILDSQLEDDPEPVRPAGRGALAPASPS